MPSAVDGLTPAETERWFATLGKTVAVDFDGVLHPYTQGWTGSLPDDESPTPGSLGFLQDLRQAGFDVIVFSTRADHPEGLEGIEQWLAKWYGADGILKVTHAKPPAVAYVDDRAVVFDQRRLNWGDCLARVRLLADGRPHGAGSFTQLPAPEPVGVVDIVGQFNDAARAVESRIDLYLGNATDNKSDTARGIVLALTALGWRPPGV